MAPMIVQSASSLLVLASSSSYQAVERSILCSDGIRLAARQWTSSVVTDPPTSNTRLLLLHGWMDNAASFDIFAPALLDRGRCAEILALDLPGHGRSAHKSADGPPQSLAEYAFYAREVLGQHEDGRPWTVVGHSMGGSVGVLLAAAWPELVERLVLLETLGPLCRPAEDVVKHLRIGAEARTKGNRKLFPEFNASVDPVIKKNMSKKTHQGKRLYPDLETAVRTRVSTARMFPGTQSISTEAARAMVERSVDRIESDQGVTFAHDTRLQWPNLQYTTEEQSRALLKAVTCPTCVVLGEQGWPIPAELKAEALALLTPTVLRTVRGSHHCHADPEDAGAVIDVVSTFLEQEKQSS